MNDETGPVGSTLIKSDKTPKNIKKIGRGDFFQVGALFIANDKDFVEKFWARLVNRDGELLTGDIEQENMLYAQWHGYKHGTRITVHSSNVLQTLRGGKAAPNKIWRFFHCAECIKEIPKGKTPREWASLEVGVTKNGEIQIWCKRHEMNVGIFKAELPHGGFCPCDKCSTAK